MTELLKPGDEVPARPGLRDRAAVVPVVGIGASAGGLEAFKEFFEHMPGGSGVAFVLVQHLDPTHKSMLGELLARSTAMPVVQIEDGMAVEPGKVFLIPPDATLTIRRGVLRLETPATPRSRRTPIDSFFCSLAEDLGDRAIGIILSGTGSDGTLGVRAINEHGGLAIAQEGASAKYDGMPRSAVATGLVDHVLAVREMSAALTGYLEHRSRIDGADGSGELPAEVADQLVTICNILRSRAGHDFRAYKESTVVRRIRRRMQVRRLSDVADYIELLRSDAGEAPLLLRDLLIGVTHFFRDPEAFEALHRRVLPGLLSDRRQEPIRLWVAGCATGEEAYSIAMLVRERLDGMRLPPKVQIFATDIDEEALAAARRGVYPDAIAAALSEDRLSRFFRRHSHGHQVVDELREMCIFSKHSLIQDPPFSKLDLISCRNLLIYLKPEVQKRLIPLFHYALKPGGYVLVGPSENVTGQRKLFKVLDKKWRLYQRRDDVERPPVHFSHRLLEGGEAAPAPPEREGAATSGQLDLAAAVERAILTHHAPACVVVNAEREIIYASSNTGPYLELPAGSPNLSLLNLARPELRMELRSILRGAARDGGMAAAPVVVAFGGERRLVRLVAQRLTAGQADDRYLVVFHDCPLPPPAAGQLPDRAGSDGSDLKALEAELGATRHHLQTVTEELEFSNEELKSANEELMSMNEELQSTNQELETSKEELQSVNEELETVNAELSNKVEQLASANGDLQNFLESTQIATVFLDRSLRIRSFTPAARDIFHFLDIDQGRPLADIAGRVEGVDVIEDARGVLKNLAQLERDVTVRGSEAIFTMRVFPYRTVANQIDGVVITFVDVSRQKTGQLQIEQLNNELRARIGELETLLDLVPIGIAIAADDECREIRLNRRGAQLLRDDKVAKPASHPQAVYRVRRGEEGVPTDELPLQKAIATGRPVEDFEATIEHRDGTRFELRMSAAPLFDESGRPRGAIGAFEDVTPIKQAQFEAENRAAQQDAVASLGNQGLTEMPSEELMRTAAELVRKVLGVDYAKVLRLEADRRHLVLAAGSGWRDVTIGETTVPADLGSQAGYTLSAAEPVVVTDLKREKRFSGPELLTRHGVRSGVSVIIGDRQAPFGVLGAHHRQRRTFTLHEVNFVQSVANVIANCLRNEKARSEQMMLVRELQHRVKNTLAVVQSLATQTLRPGQPVEAVAPAFHDRIRALARAQNLLTSEGWQNAALRDVLEAELRPFGDARESNIRIRGHCPVRLRPGSAVALAMAVHELATNAAKYGALASPAGRVDLSLEMVEEAGGPAVRIHGRESGGPPVAAPRQRGLGLQLVQGGLEHSLGATVALAFHPSGFECTVLFPLEEA